MTILSLKRFIDSRPIIDYRAVILLLVDAVGLHAVKSGSRELAAFQGNIQEIKKRFEAAQTHEGMLLCTGSLIQAIASYNRSITDSVGAQENELQTIISILTSSLVSLAAETECSSNNLESIELKLRRAKDVTDLQQLRVRLEECLAGVRSEAVKQKKETKILIESLKTELVGTQQRLLGHSLSENNDAVTGLPHRHAAETAIQNAINSAESNFIFVSVLPILSSINAQFGRATGDELFCRIVNIFIEELSARASLFRWTGPTIVAIFHKIENMIVIRSDVNRILESPKLKSLSYCRATSLINLPIAWTTVPLLPPVLDTIKAIDKFVEAQTTVQRSSHT